MNEDIFRYLTMILSNINLKYARRKSYSLYASAYSLMSCQLGLSTVDRPSAQDR